MHFLGKGPPSYAEIHNFNQLRLPLICFPWRPLATSGLDQFIRMNHSQAAPCNNCFGVIQLTTQERLAFCLCLVCLRFAHSSRRSDATGSHRGYTSSLLNMMPCLRMPQYVVVGPYIQSPKLRMYVNRDPSPSNQNRFDIHIYSYTYTYINICI